MRFFDKPISHIALSAVLLAVTSATYAESAIAASQDGSAGTAAKSRYEVHGDSVYDTTTNLTWARCSVGQHWQDATGCTGSTSQLSWDEAQQLNSGPWRLPTRDELTSLSDPDRAARHVRPALDITAFPQMDPTKLWYWASDPKNSALSWLVGFDEGDVLNGTSLRGSGYSVRLVHAGR